MAVSIAAVSVNHNTSAYMELMLRSLYRCHPADLPLSLTIFDNDSTDDMTELVKYATRQRVRLVPSGFTTATRNNSHGEILRRFVLTQPDCTHYLFLDADVCFLQRDTLQVMLNELERSPTAFAIGPRLSWDGEQEMPLTLRQNDPDICDARLHPCCALVRNIPLFQRVVLRIGLSAVQYLWANEAEYLDTFKLMTLTMQTHGLTHIISSVMVQHFFNVSYPWDNDATAEFKAQLRDRRLRELRYRERQEAR